MTDEINYTHGDAGSQPPDGNNFEEDERPQASYFDWYISTFVSKINSLVTEVDNILSGATQVGDADQVDGQDYADIQNWVETSADVPNADHADTATSADDADTVDGEHASAFADTNHGNEEHSSSYTTLTEVNNNADVPNADYADNAGDADTVDGQDYADIQNWVETTAKANDADTVDGYEGEQLLGGEGGFNLPSTDLPSGDFTALGRVPFPSGTTVSVRKVSCINGSFNSPTGLNLVFYDVTNSTTLASYNGYSEPGDSLDVGGKDVIIAADNGNYGAGTGATEENVTAFATVRIE